MNIDIIKKFEGFKSTPYDDYDGQWKSQDKLKGKATIGYGTTEYPNGIKVKMSDNRISEKQANDYLTAYISKYVSPALDYVKTPININQKSALISLVYNIGPEAFRKSTLLKKLNMDDFKGAASEFLKWDKIKKIKSEGLAFRRKQEMELFMTRPHEEYIPKEIPLAKKSKFNIMEWVKTLF